jgi:hypothetical protein
MKQIGETEHGDRVYPTVDGLVQVLPFEMGARVHLDDDDDLTMRVTGYAIYAHGVQVQTSWMVNGDLKSAWVEPWRLTEVSPN